MLQWNNPQAAVFVPDGLDPQPALARTTDLCIAAHQDDIEIMAFSPAAKCYGKQDEWFTGVVVTDGAGSPRCGLYADYTDEQMKAVRVVEQNTAAIVGGYAAQVQLGYASGAVKDPADTQTVRDLAAVIAAARPRTVYTHNPADKHDTHVAVALRTVAALRSLPEQLRPKKVYAMEVWRGLDWVCDEQKVCFDTSAHPNLAAALVGVYDSQIAGGKRYDSAALGRRLANATFFASHATDDCESLSYGLDMTTFVYSAQTPQDFIDAYIQAFRGEVLDRLRRLS